MHAGWPPAHVVGDRQTAAPGLRRHRSAEGGQQRLGVAVRDRQGRNLHQHLGFRDRNALGVGRRADIGRERVAGLYRDVQHRAALHALVRPPGALGIGVAGAIAIVGGVRIDDAADGAMLIGQLDLQAPPSLAIADDDDLALHVDAHAGQDDIVVGIAVVDVDQVARDIAIGGVDQIGRQGVLAHRRRGVARQWRFIEAGLERRWPDQFQRFMLWRGVEDLEGLDARVPAPGFQLVTDEFRIGLVVRGADFVRRRREQLQTCVDRAGGKARIETGFQRAFAVGALRRKAQQGRRASGGSLGGGERERGENGTMLHDAALGRIRSVRQTSDHPRRRRRGVNRQTSDAAPIVLGLRPAPP